MEKLYNKALEYMNNNQIDEAIECYKELANSNHILSIKALLEIYGKGKYYNLTEILYWKEKLAELDDYDAILYLAKYYYDTHKNQSEALKYIDLAISKGYKDGYYYLFNLYRDGNNEFYDLELSDEYFKIALELNCVEAVRSYGYDKVAYTTLSYKELIEKGFEDNNKGYLIYKIVNDIELAIDLSDYKIALKRGDLLFFGLAQSKLGMRGIFEESDITFTSNISSYKTTDIIPLPKESFIKLKESGYYMFSACYDPQKCDVPFLIADHKILDEEVNPEGFHMYVGNLGFANVFGEVVVKPQFSKATSYFDDKAIVVDKNNKYAMIDKTGKYLLNHEFELIEYEQHFKPFSDYDEYIYLAYKDGMCYFYNDKIELVHKMKSDVLEQDYYLECMDNVLKIKMFNDSKVTFINTITKEQSSFELDFDEINILSNKYLYLISDGKYYITDYNLNPVTDIEFRLPMDTFFKHTDGKWYLPCYVNNEKVYLNEHMELCVIDIEE